MGKHRLWLLTPLLFTVTGCAATNKQCDYVFFVPTHCVDPAHPVYASREATLPAARPVANPPPVVEQPATPATPAKEMAVAPKKEETATVAKVETPPAPPPAPPPAEEQPQAIEVPPVNVIYFGPGQDVLSDGDVLTLKKIADYLKQTRTETIQLVAYTDPVGSVKKNEQLASRRADKVAKTLAQLGVEQSRMTVLAPNVHDSKGVAPAEYWRLRKTVVLYGAETVARIKAQEQAEEARLATELRPENAPNVEPKDKGEGDKGEADKGQKGEAKAEGDKGDKGPKLERVDVIYWKNVTHGLFIIAKKAGFFEQEGFDVRLHESHLEANELNMQLAEGNTKMQVTRIPYSAMDVKSHKYFLGAVCPYGFHEALSEKMPFVQIGAMLSNPVTFLAKKELVAAAQKNLRNFRGAVIARSKELPNGFDNNFLLLDRLNAVGLKEGVDYKYKYYANDNLALAALAKGEVDVMESSPPNDLEFVKRHPDYGIFPVSSLNMNLPCCRQVVTRENLKKYRDKYVRFERAVIRAEAFLHEHPDQAIEILGKFLGMPSSTVRSVLQRPGFRLSANPNVRGSKVFADVMAQRLGKAKVGDVRESIDTSIYEEALASLIKKEPSPVYNEMLARYRGTR